MAKSRKLEKNPVYRPYKLTFLVIIYLYSFLKLISQLNQSL